MNSRPLSMPPSGVAIGTSEHVQSSATPQQALFTGSVTTQPSGYRLESFGAFAYQVGARQPPPESAVSGLHE